MINFLNDYNGMACKEVIQKMLELSNYKYIGYGEDEICERAKELIRQEIKKDVPIYFIVGGTITNLTVISHILKPYEAVISTDVGHINTHETGAIEATGHKIITVESVNGKLTMESVEHVLKTHTNHHMVKPKLVYISNATEIGTIYTKKELEKLYLFCKKNNLYLFIDGARLGSALMSSENGNTLEDISNHCDIFYIGATKNGGGLGEAVVFTNKNLSDGFHYHMKNKGALLAKGFLLGIQFETLFTNHLFYRLAAHANQMAQILKEGLIKRGFQQFIETSTNQLFIIVNNQLKEELKNIIYFNEIEQLDDLNFVIRFVTSYNTTEKEVIEFFTLLDKIR